MKKAAKKLSGRTKKLVAIFMAVAMVVAFIPLFDNFNVSAEEPCTPCDGTGKFNVYACPEHEGFLKYSPGTCDVPDCTGVIEAYNAYWNHCGNGCGAGGDSRLYFAADEIHCGEEPAVDQGWGIQCPTCGNTSGYDNNYIALGSPCPNSSNLCGKEFVVIDTVTCDNCDGTGSIKVDTGDDENNNVIIDGDEGSENVGCTDCDNCDDCNGCGDCTENSDSISIPGTIFTITEEGYVATQIIDAKSGHSSEEELLSIVGFRVDIIGTSWNNNFHGSVRTNAKSGNVPLFTFGGHGTDKDHTVDHGITTRLEFNLGESLFATGDFDGWAQIYMEANWLENGATIGVANIEWIYDTLGDDGGGDTSIGTIGLPDDINDLFAWNADMSIVNGAAVLTTTQGYDWTSAQFSYDLGDSTLADVETVEFYFQGIDGSDMGWKSPRLYISQEPFANTGAHGAPYITASQISDLIGDHYLVFDVQNSELEDALDYTGVVYFAFSIHANSGQTYAISNSPINLDGGGDTSIGTIGLPDDINDLFAWNADMTISNGIATLTTTQGYDWTSAQFSYDLGDSTLADVETVEFYFQGIDGSDMGWKSPRLYISQEPFANTGAHGAPYITAPQISDLIGDHYLVFDVQNSELEDALDYTGVVYFAFSIHANSGQTYAISNNSFGSEPIVTPPPETTPVPTITPVPGVGTPASIFGTEKWSLDTFNWSPDNGNQTVSLETANIGGYTNTLKIVGADTSNNWKWGFRVSMADLGITTPGEHTIAVTYYVPADYVNGLTQLQYIFPSNWGGEYGGYKILGERYPGIVSGAWTTVYIDFSATAPLDTSTVFCIQPNGGTFVNAWYIASVSTGDAACAHTWNESHKCTKCGENHPEGAGHIYVDQICRICGKVEPGQGHPCENGHNIRQNAAPNAGTHGCTEGCNIFQGNTRNWDPHTYSNGVCTVCGASACSTHTWRFYNSDVHTCENCPEWTPHTYGSNFLCTGCGYSHPCANGHQVAFYNADGHNCARNCGGLDFEPHSYSNGVCTGCGYVAGAAIGAENLCANGHLVTFYNTDGHNCGRNCGGLDFEPHSFVNGVCTGCGYNSITGEAPAEGIQQILTPDGDVIIGFDADGNAIIGFDEDGNAIVGYDEDGNAIIGYDEEGNPIVISDSETPLAGGIGDNSTGSSPSTLAIVLGATLGVAVVGGGTTVGIVMKKKGIGLFAKR